MQVNRSSDPANAFKRSKYIFQMLADGFYHWLVPAYVSRGKGGAKPHRATGAAGIKRAALKSRNSK